MVSLSALHHRSGERTYYRLIGDSIEVQIWDHSAGNVTVSGTVKQDTIVFNRSRYSELFGTHTVDFDMPSVYVFFPLMLKDTTTW